MKKLAAFILFFAFIAFKGAYAGEAAKPGPFKAFVMPLAEGGSDETPADSSALEKEDDQHPASFRYQSPYPVELAQFEPVPDQRSSIFRPAPGTPPPDVC